MRLIDGDALKDRLQRLAYSDWNQGVRTTWADAYGNVSVMVENEPTIEPTLYGYKLDHLAFVAALLQNKGITEENLADVLNSVDWIVGMILNKAKEKTMQVFIKNEVEE